MEKSLTNKVVAVTGGANGIGREIADKYLQHGAKVVILLDTDEIQGAETVKTLTNKYGDGKVVYIKCNVTTDLETVFQIILKNHKTVNALVLNAGISDPSVPKLLIDINLTSVIEWTMKFLQHMRKDAGGNGGTIISISSILGLKTIPYTSVYQASKFGVNAFTKALGHEETFKTTGVRILAICPGFTETNLSVCLRDPKFQELVPRGLVTFANDQGWQKAEDVGNAAVKVYEIADSGTLWLIEGNKPIQEVTNIFP